MCIRKNERCEEPRNTININRNVFSKWYIIISVNLHSYSTALMLPFKHNKLNERVFAISFDFLISFYLCRFLLCQLFFLNLFFFITNYYTGNWEHITVFFFFNESLKCLLIGNISDLKGVSMKYYIVILSASVHQAKQFI